MLFALLLGVSLVDWVPARWISAEPGSLDLVKGTPINCLLLEQNQWSAALGERAASQGIVTLGVIRRGGDPVEAARGATNCRAWFWRGISSRRWRSGCGIRWPLPRRRWSRCCPGGPSIPRQEKL